MKIEPNQISGCFKCLRITIIVFSVLAWIFGLTIFIVGIVSRVNGSLGPLEEYIPSVHEGANLLIAVGLIIMIICVFGFFGAVKESQPLLFLFFITLFLSFALLMGAGLWASANKDRMKGMLRMNLEKLVFENKGDSNKIKAMNYIQKRFKCCGVTSSADYGNRVPDSCKSENYDMGCENRLLDFIRDNLKTIAGLGIGLGILFIIGMVSTLTMCCMLNEKWDESREPMPYNV